MGILKKYLFIQCIYVTYVRIITSEQTSGNCDAQNLHNGYLIQCIDENSKKDIRIAREIPSKTSCVLQCQDTNKTTQLSCINGEWNGHGLSDCKLDSQLILTRKKRFLDDLIEWVVCLFGCEPDDNTPPQLGCPSDIHTNADVLQINAKVTWIEPTANDDRDGAIRPSRHGKGPGRHFSENDSPTTIGYHARDNSGNWASCEFKIYVTVVRCPRLQPVSNGYYICHPSDDPRYGAGCRFGCYRGYELKGDSYLTCTVSGTWNRQAPHCEKLTCPQLNPPVAPVRYKCSDDNKFRSICTYSCSSGYDITPGMSRVRVCTDRGVWNGNEPTCSDIEPPVIKNCKRTVFIYAERNSSYGSVSWTTPTAYDNHDTSVTVIKEGSISPLDRKPAGTYHVTYVATDAAGNKAVPCKMSIFVKVLRCPVIYTTPFLGAYCPHGVKYGSHCEFQCDPGSYLNGSEVVVCEKDWTRNYASWTWEKHQPFCNVYEKCAENPNIPENGALACDNWVGGKFCKMMCKKGFDVRVGNFLNMIVCEDGRWLRNPLPLPDCTRTILSLGGRIKMTAEYYFEGDCTDPNVVAQIQAKFIQTLNSSAEYADVCLVFAKHCTTDNVKVYCGLTNKKRSLRSLQINFDVIAEFESETFEESFSEFRRNQDQIVFSFKKMENQRLLDFSVVAGGSLQSKQIENKGVVLGCPANTLPSYKTSSCVECTAGTYFDSNSQSCLQCPRGSYQNMTAQNNCIHCPVTTTTKTFGAKILSDCIGGCEPGSWSTSGIPPCTLCRIGTYEDKYGSDQCSVCPRSMSTIEEGSTNITKCQEFDLMLAENNSSFRVKVKDLRNIQNFTLSAWIKKESINDSLNVVFLGNNNDEEFGIELGSDTTIFMKKFTFKTEYQLGDNKWHFLAISHYANYTKLYVDGVKYAEIDMYLHLYDIELVIKGEGTISQLNMWQSITISNITEMSKSCFLVEEGDILGWKEFENIDEENVFKNIPSECDDFNDCISNPCLHGVCVDNLGGYECICFYGHYGETCDGNIDDCIENACENNSTCIDGGANYTCQCPYGYKGDLCEIAIVDGSWNKWGEWSSCSQTCGNGTRHRKRYCNDPVPDNGGLQCPGNDTEYGECSDGICPKCTVLERLEHVVWSCDNSSDNINCTISCERGYSFDHNVKPYYLCSKATFYLWNFQTDDNPDGKMPICSAIQSSDELKVTYKASYKYLRCDNDNIHTETQEKVKNTVNDGLKTLPCMSSKECNLDNVVVTDCSQRYRRSLIDQTAGFEISVSCQTSKYGTDICYNVLQSLVRELQKMADNSTFDTNIQGTIYEIEASNATAKGIAVCPRGAVSVQYYCVYCSKGRYFSNGRCLKCTYGTYQDGTGQSTCKLCPEGTTTPGKESRAITECSVQRFSENSNVTALTVALVMITIMFCTIVVVTVLLIRWKMLKKNSTTQLRNLPTKDKLKASKQSFIK